MTAHLIIGDGNLGRDLHVAMTNAGLNSLLIPFEMSNAWRANDFPELRDMAVIWLCTGGRHAEAKLNPRQSHRHNIEIPRLIMERAADRTRLVFFSTLDCAHPEHPTRPHYRTADPLSEFARQKLELEGTIIAQKRPLTAYVRLGPLYGEHRPLTTFPGRLLGQEWPENSALSLPNNEVAPTPSEWAAQALLRTMDKNLWNPSTYTCHHLAPTGSIAVFDWAKLIFGQARSARGFFEKITWDHTRPRIQQGGTSLDVHDEHWSTLWGRYFRRESYQRKA